jgi:hypothetical protein
MDLGLFVPLCGATSGYTRAHVSMGGTARSQWRGQGQDAYSVSAAGGVLVKLLHERRLLEAVCVDAWGHPQQRLCGLLWCKGVCWKLRV